MSKIKNKLNILLLAFVALLVFKTKKGYKKPNIWENEILKYIEEDKEFYEREYKSKEEHHIIVTY